MIAFRRRHPGVSVQLFTGNSTRVVERVVALEADVGLIAVTSRIAELARHLLLIDPVVLVVPRRHALARHRTIRTRRSSGIATMGQGLGVVSRRSVIGDMRTGHLRVVEIHAGGRPIRQPVYLVHHVERREAPLVRAVLEIARELHTTHRRRAPSEGIS